ncbi:MAG: hypothetical protein E7289_00970 [Lachnospiraceae bacterium]|nr:hypothetical protein [Lachnospiraceae bacterium]
MNEKIWQQLDLAEVNALVERMANVGKYGFSDITQELATGNFSAAMEMIGAALTDICLPGIRESKSLLVTVLVLGLFSMLLHYTFGVVKSRQVADIAHYLVYLLLVLLLLKCFGQMMETGREVLEVCRQFMAALVPAYCLSVSLAGGAVTAAAHYEFVILLLAGMDYILAGLLLPVTQSYAFLVIMDGLDEKRRMKEFVRLLERLISWGIRLCLTVTVAVSGLQNAISTRLDGVQKTVFQKAVGALPGIGDMSESVTNVLLGSAGLIQSSIGAAAMVFLFLVILRPVWKLLCISMSMKLAAACVRMMGQSQMSDTITKIGDGGILVMRIVTCAAIAFCVSVAMTMLMLKGGG